MRREAGFELEQYYRGGEESTGSLQKNNNSSNCIFKALRILKVFVFFFFVLNWKHNVDERQSPDTMKKLAMPWQVLGT